MFDKHPRGSCSLLESSSAWLAAFDSANPDQRGASPGLGHLSVCGGEKSTLGQVKLF